MMSYLMLMSQGENRDITIRFYKLTIKILIAEVINIKTILFEISMEYSEYVFQEITSINCYDVLQMLTNIFFGCLKY